MIVTGACMLCRNRAELRSSHVVPFSVLNELSADRITNRNKQVIIAVDYSLKQPLTLRSPRQVAHKMLCGACENRLSLNAETSFVRSSLNPSLTGAVIQFRMVNGCITSVYAWYFVD